MGYDKFAECIELKKQLAAMTKERDTANARIERLRIALENISNGALSTREKMREYADRALNTDAKGEPS